MTIRSLHIPETRSHPPLSSTKPQLTVQNSRMEERMFSDTTLSQTLRISRCLPWMFSALPSSTGMPSAKWRKAG